MLDLDIDNLKIPSSGLCFLVNWRIFIYHISAIGIQIFTFDVNFFRQFFNKKKTQNNNNALTNTFYHPDLGTYKWRGTEFKEFELRR